MFRQHHQTNSSQQPKVMLPAAAAAAPFPVVNGDNYGRRFTWSIIDGRRQIVRKPMYRAVLFDMGGVLVKYINPSAYEQLIDKAHTNKAIAEMLQDFDLGHKSAEELRELFAELLPNLPKLNVEEVAQVENTALVDEGLLAIMPQLRQAGLKVAIVTNNGFWSNRRQRTVMLSDTTLFDLVIESCKIGLRKPDPDIFLKAAELLGVRPQECIFIDDTEGHCRGAESVGMKAIHMANCETGPVVKKLAEMVGIPLSTVKHRINLVENGRRETFIWTYNPLNFIKRKNNNQWNLPLPQQQQQQQRQAMMAMIGGGGGQQQQQKKKLSAPSTTTLLHQLQRKLTLRKADDAERAENGNNAGTHFTNNSILNK